MSEISILELLKNGVHFGHSKSRLHPKMAPYVFVIRNSISIIDLEKTKEKLTEANNFLTEVAKKGGTILFISTKRQAKDIIREYAEKAKMPYITEHWIGGLLTNFPIVSRLITKYKNLRNSQEKRELDKYTKKERLKFKKEIDKLKNLVGGLEGLESLPQALFIIDSKQEKTAIKEANKKKIPIVAIIDTNSNPSLIDYPIPANDDATKSIELITRLITESIIKGKEKIKDGKKVEIKKDKEKVATENTEENKIADKLTIKNTEEM